MYAIGHTEYKIDNGDSLKSGTRDKLGSVIIVFTLEASQSAVFLENADGVRKRRLDLASGFCSSEVIPDLVVDSDQIDFERLFDIVAQRV